MLTVLAVLGVLVVLLASHRFGRAEPTADYRPDPTAPTLETGCYPLPGGVEPDFAHQIRRDGDVDTEGGPRRHLLVQYDEIDAPAVRRSLVDDFVAAGFTEDPAPGAYDAVLRRRSEVVRITVQQLTGIEEDTLVRGTIRFDLPVAEQRPDAPAVCDDPKSTKRWDARG